MIRFLFIAISFCAAELTMMPAATAQQSSPATASQTLRQQLAQTEARRKNRIAGNMLLSGEEARSFWPVYDEYRGAVVTVRGRQLDVIVEYADAYNQGGLAPDKAEALRQQARHLFPPDKTPLFAEVVPVIGAHIGPGAVGFVAIKARG